MSTKRKEGFRWPKNPKPAKSPKTVAEINFSPTAVPSAQWDFTPLRPAFPYSRHQEKYSAHHYHPIAQAKALNYANAHKKIMYEEAKRASEDPLFATQKVEKLKDQLAPEIRYTERQLEKLPSEVQRVEYRPNRNQVNFVNEHDILDYPEGPSDRVHPYLYKDLEEEEEELVKKAQYVNLESLSNKRIKRYEKKVQEMFEKKYPYYSGSGKGEYDLYGPVYKP